MRGETSEFTNGNVLTFEIDQAFQMFVSNLHLVFKSQIRQDFSCFKVVIDLVEEIRIAHSSATNHDRISTDFFDPLFGILNCADISVCDKWNLGQSLCNLVKGLKIRMPRIHLLPSSPMHGKGRDTRSFGSDPELVAKMSAAYMEGAHSTPGFACTAKHFPGNGLDFRDAHIANNVNTFDPATWDATYGMVYKTMFDNGLEAVMGGHIMLPEYAKLINPDLKDEDIMPATLSPEIMTGLLRDRMGFNGVVVTDASHMVAMTNRMKRSEMLPRAINAGCDMFLFFNDPDEDFSVMLEAYRNGTIREERMTEALTRILGLKAHLGLNKRKPEELVPTPEFLEKVLGKEEYKETAKSISRDCLTLVKYKDREVLPITPERYQRIMIVHVKGSGGAMGELMKLMGGSKENPAELLKQKLCDRGFDAFIYESPMDKMKKQMEQGEKPSLDLYFAGKNAVKDFIKDMDLVITLCDVPSGRPVFGMSKGGGEIPWYVFELPVVVVGCGQPTMLADIPQARTYINTYDARNDTLGALVDALMKGPEAFPGTDPIDSFCGLFDTRL